MVAYVTENDVYSYALPRGSLGNPGRIVDSALASNSVITLSEHGYQTGTPITFNVTQGGLLASPLVAGTEYFAIYLTDSTFQVSATLNGPPITLTANAVSMIVQTDLPWAQVCEFYSRFADSFLPAEAVPLQAPYPISVVGVVAQLVARRMQILSGTTSASMEEVEASAAKQLERFAKNGLPVRDAATAQVQTNLSVQNTPPNGQTPTLQTVTTNDPLNVAQVFATPTPQDPRGWAVTGSNMLP